MLKSKTMSSSILLFFNSNKEKLPSNRKKTGKSASRIKSKAHTFHFCFCTAVSTGHTRYGKLARGEIRKIKVCFTVTDLLSASLRCGQQYYVTSPFLLFTVLHSLAQKLLIIDLRPLIHFHQHRIQDECMWRWSLLEDEGHD